MSSIHVCLLLFGIDSVIGPIRHGWTFIFKTKIHVCLHGQTFSNLVFSWVLLSVSPDVCLSHCLHQVLLILFSCYSSIQHFSYVNSAFIFFFKIVLFLWRLFFYLSLCLLHQLVGLIDRIFFHDFGRSYFVLLVPVQVPFESFFFCQYLMIHLFQLFVVIFFESFHSISFTFLSSFACCLLKFVNSALNVCSNLIGCFEVVLLSPTPKII